MISLKEVNPKGDWEENEMEAQWKPSDSENELPDFARAEGLRQVSLRLK
jgi:hypothetical protein